MQLLSMSQYVIYLLVVIHNVARKSSSIL